MKDFFDRVRRSFGSLSQEQVDGFNVILKATEKLPIPWRAYILATAWHETARTMQPIEEYGKGKGRPYGKPVPPYGKAYYGRGYVQLTWDYNYKNATQQLRAKGLLPKDADLLKNPELAMVPDTAANILVLGMIEGWFCKRRDGSGVKLSDFGQRDYVPMRRIINGTDKAVLIAGHALTFEAALKNAGAHLQPVPPPPPPPPPEPEKPAPEPSRGFWKWLYDWMRAGK